MIKIILSNRVYVNFIYYCQNKLNFFNIIKSKDKNE